MCSPTCIFFRLQWVLFLIQFVSRDVFPYWSSFLFHWAVLEISDNTTCLYDQRFKQAFVVAWGRHQGRAAGRCKKLPAPCPLPAPPPGRATFAPDTCPFLTLFTLLPQKAAWTHFNFQASIFLKKKTFKFQVLYVLSGIWSGVKGWSPLNFTHLSLKNNEFGLFVYTFSLLLCWSKLNPPHAEIV